LNKSVSLFATLMLASSMVAIGALVDWRSLRQSGSKPILMAFVGALLLGAVVFGVASLWGTR
jgi:uncharacterized membrane protein YadS